MTCADFPGSGGVTRQMHMMSSHFLQAIAKNTFVIRFCASVVEYGGWSGGGKFEIDFDGMPLIGSDSCTRLVDGKPLFITGSDDFIEFGTGNREADIRGGGE